MRYEITDNYFRFVCPNRERIGRELYGEVLRMLGKASTTTWGGSLRRPRLISSGESPPLRGAEGGGERERK